MYLPPAITVCRVELEKSIVVDGSVEVQNITFGSFGNHVNDWDETELGAAVTGGKGGDVYLLSW
jgi:hypothetical protein